MGNKNSNEEYSNITLNISNNNNNPVCTRQSIVLNSSHGESLLKIPSLSKLQLRSWLIKRGHIVRSWKRRYFVLTSNSLKYYKKEIPVSPYGENLCGELSLRGAVLEYIKSSDKYAYINIIGRPGEIDLMIKLSSTNDLVWLTALEWTIRRCCRSYITLLRNNYSIQFNVKEKLKLKDVNCKDWLDNEVKKFENGISNLLVERTVSMFVYQRDGTTSILEYNLLLWSNTIVSDSICTKRLPTVSTFTTAYGIKYYPYCGETIDNEAFLKDIETFSVSFDDIIDLVERNYIDSNCSLSKTCTNKMCTKKRVKIYSLETCHGHSLNFHACCLYDYDDLILSIRNILLYIYLRVPTEENSYMIKDLDIKFQEVPCINAKMKTLTFTT